jgi:transposase
LRRVQRKLLSTDPQRPAILSRIRQIWNHLPTTGVLLFFDVKPVFVKAYGGRRYSSAPRLVLPRQQKTRGKFYVFAAYDVRTGRVRWAFLEGKSSSFVIRFLRQIRRWYPEQEVWVALDQDGAHPCKAKATQQAMRTLRLHWVSLPKGSPDDNPVETLFSDVQLMILDNSNDRDAAATRRRISAHWRRRNRRRDRHIQIPYLGGSDKQ